MEFSHKLFSGPTEQVPAMNRVKSILANANFSGIVFPFSKGYAAWETDEVCNAIICKNVERGVFFRVLLYSGKMNGGVILPKSNLGDLTS